MICGRREDSSLLGYDAAVDWSRFVVNGSSYRTRPQPTLCFVRLVGMYWLRVDMAGRRRVLNMLVI
jgi:hypothetical protein